MNLFLDDLRPPPKGFIHAKTVEEAYQITYHARINILSLDHDLGGIDGKYKKTGYDYCKLQVELWQDYREKELFDRLLYPRQIYLHTANPVGRANMFQLLNRYKHEDIEIHRCPLPNFNLATGELIPLN